MIKFDMLTKDDYAILFEGFEKSFLQQPFKRPSKSLQRYIPNGFRAEKLKVNQMINVFTNAIMGKEPSITQFVTHEIESQFGAAGIIDYIEARKDTPETLLGAGIASLSTLLWTHGLREPSYIALLLCGIPCTDETKAVSKELYEAHFGIIADCTKASFEDGRSQGEQKLNDQIAEEKKKVAQLERKVETLSSQKNGLSIDLQKAKDEKEDVLSEIASLNERMEELKYQIETSGKEKIHLNNQIRQKQVEIENCQTEMLNIREQISTISEKDQEICLLKSELKSARGQAYSDEVLSKICNDILDELTASTPSKDELLRIAKRKFSNEETVLAGWEKLSEESNEIVSMIINEFSSSVFSEEQLDKLELLEDGILIRYAVSKALKATLFNALEKAETESTISNRFGGEN